MPAKFENGFSDASSAFFASTSFSDDEKVSRRELLGVADNEAHGRPQSMPPYHLIEWTHGLGGRPRITLYCY
jgi:hypothetical protein